MVDKRFLIINEDEYGIEVLEYIRKMEEEYENIF